VFASGCDFHLYHIFRDQGGYSGWEDLGYLNIYGGPAAVSTGYGTLDVLYVRGSDNHLMDRWWSNGWHLTDTGTVGHYPYYNQGGVGVAAMEDDVQRIHKAMAFVAAVSPPNQPGVFAAEQNTASSWFAPQNSFLDQSNAQPYPVFDGQAGVVEVYYRVPSSGYIRRRAFLPFDRGWFTSTTNLGNTSFAGEPNGQWSHVLTGIFVIGTKADGTVWWAHDTDT